MQTYKVCLFANDEAGAWTSWNEKIAAIKAFFAPVCDIDITVTPTKLTPQFAPYSGTPGDNAIYQVDEAWYETNVRPLAGDANIVIFVVPPSDHTVPCLMGLEAGHPIGTTWQTTIFVNETDHTFINGVDQGETAVEMAKHELSHVFYAMLARTDNTHLYFYAGTPEKVLADFDFDEELLSDYQKVIQLLEEKLGLLKARQIAPQADTAPSKSQNLPPQSVPTPETTQTSFPPKILAWAQIIDKEEGSVPSHHNPGNLGYSTLTASWGAVRGPAKTDGGNLAIFLDDNAGLTALCYFLVLGCEDQLLDYHAVSPKGLPQPQARTLAGFTDIYANHPNAGYKNAIVQAMGGDPNVQITTFLS